jgi:hypothetical protein
MLRQPNQSDLRGGFLKDQPTISQIDFWDGWWLWTDLSHWDIQQTVAGNLKNRPIVAVKWSRYTTTILNRPKAEMNELVASK